MGSLKSRREKQNCSKKSEGCTSSRKSFWKKWYHFRVTIGEELSLEEFNKKVEKIIELGEDVKIIENLANKVHIPGLINLGGGKYQLDMDSSDDEITLNAVPYTFLSRKSG